jgi:hypothetical protein
VRDLGRARTTPPILTHTQYAGGFAPALVKVNHPSDIRRVFLAHESRRHRQDAVWCAIQGRARTTPSPHTHAVWFCSTLAKVNQPCDIRRAFLAHESRRRAKIGAVRDLGRARAIFTPPHPHTHARGAVLLHT